jgi:tRNA A-37 threonylcarbamoyl transferase component Bud32
LSTPDAFAQTFASARPEADAIELAGAQRALRARLLERPSLALCLHRYELRGCLGGGGSGSVFEAFDPELDRKVAIKILRHRDENETGHEDAQEQLLLSEARAMARASDPRVVAVYDVGRSPERFLAHAGEPAGSSRVFIVMEHVEGQTLRRWLAGEVRLDQVVRIFLDAAAGLIAAHRSGVVHGDFKPENVMITPDHRVKILDFGIARVMGSGIGHLGFTGTPYYAAPEQLGGAAPDAKSDQYSFCRSLEEAARRASSADSRAVARDVARIVRRGLEASPERRFASMQQLAAALAEVSRPTERSSKLVPIALAVLAGIASGIAGEKIPSVPVGSGCIEAGLEDTWNPARASRLEQAFRSTQLAYADDSWRSVVTEIGAYAAQFRQALGAACTLTRRSAAVRCLEERHRVLDTLLAVMEERPNAVVPQAIDAAFSLRSPGSCLSARDVPDSLPMPACAGDVERELYALDAGLTAATFADGVSRSAMARTAAFQCAPKHLGPWAELVHGLHLLNAAQWAEASTTLRAAFLAAEAAGDARAAMRAMIGQIVAYERRGEVSHVDRLI